MLSGCVAPAAASFMPRYGAIMALMHHHGAHGRIACHFQKVIQWLTEATTMACFLLMVFLIKIVGSDLRIPTGLLSFQLRRKTWL